MKDKQEGINKKVKICATCEWRYETHYSVGCNSPSPDRVIYAGCEHFYEPCDIWEEKK